METYSLKSSEWIKFMCGFLVFMLQFSSFHMFNFNVNARVEFTPPVNRNARLSSYFGYSLLVRTGQNSLPIIIVGAPRDTNDLTPSVDNPGMIYICEVPKPNNSSRVLCKPKYIDKRGNERDGYRVIHHKKDNMWLGMTMVGSNNSDDNIVVCAPRWINQYHKVFYLVNGLCYSVSRTGVDTDFTLKPLIPLVVIENQGFQPFYHSDSSYFYAFGEAGMSMKLASNGVDLIIGAPGIYAWTGSVIHYKILKQSNGSHYFVKRRVPNPYYTSELTESSYFGYSVDCGYFGRDEGLIFVAGAPRGADYKGQVVLFDFPIKDASKLLIYTILEGEQMGEYFGHSLLVVDINKDGLDDLIVGAPLYSQEYHYDQGRIIAFINNDNRNLRKQYTLIAGDLISGARFGSTLANLGDINHDGFNDVAVAAPYEDEGRGAVYIYYGSAFGLNPTYAQKITVAETKGFGISINTGIDVDGNGCNDLVVGAHESGQVVLLYAHPFLDVESEMSPLPMEISIHDTNFTAQVCLKYKSETTSSITRIVVTLKVDEEYNRASLYDLSNAKFYIDGESGHMYCKDVVVLINTEVHDYFRPIDIRMEYDLETNPMNDTIFCQDCAILDPNVSKRGLLRVPFASGCGNDSVCQPDLKLKVNLSVESPYVIGSSGSIVLNITLINTGEPAFIPKVEFTSPANAPVLRVPPKCHLIDALLSCDFDNPLLVGAEGLVSIELDTRGLKSTDEVLFLNITATSAGDEVTPSDNLVVVNLTLKSEANITLTGYRDALMDTYVYMKPASNGTNITMSHTYEVQNLGPSPLEVFKVVFFFPVEYTDLNNITYPIAGITEPVDTLNQAPFICRASNGQFFIPPNEGHVVSIDVTDDNNSDGANTESTISQTTPAPSSTMTYDSHDNYTLSTDGFDELLQSSFDLPLQVNEDNFPKITSIDINCTDTSRVKCLMVQCIKTAGLPVSTNGAHLNFKIILNHTNINKLLNDKQSIIYSTYSATNSIHNTMVYSYARSLLIGGVPPPSPTPIWIYIVAIICGILLLSLISFGLYKCNFFKRQKRDELQLLQHTDANQCNFLKRQKSDELQLLQHTDANQGETNQGLGLESDDD